MEPLLLVSVTLMILATAALTLCAVSHRLQIQVKTDIETYKNYLKTTLSDLSQLHNSSLIEMSDLKKSVSDLEMIQNLKKGPK